MVELSSFLIGSLVPIVEQQYPEEQSWLGFPAPFFRPSPIPPPWGTHGDRGMSAGTYQVGEIYPRTKGGVPKRTIAILMTTPFEDIQWLAYMEDSRVGTRGRYSWPQYSCRTFAMLEFQKAAKRFPGARVSYM